MRVGRADYRGAAQSGLQTRTAARRPPAAVAVDKALDDMAQPGAAVVCDCAQILTRTGFRAVIVAADGGGRRGVILIYARS